MHLLVPHLEVLVLESKEGKRTAANAWNSDVTFDAEPPLGSTLLAREVPDRGGDMLWAHMYSAYEARAPSIKRSLEGMTAVQNVGFAQFEKTFERGDGRTGAVKE